MRKPPIIVALLCLILGCIALSACSENVPQREAREKIEQRVKELERAEWKK